MRLRRKRERNPRKNPYPRERFRKKKVEEWGKRTQKCRRYEQSQTVIRTIQ